MGLEQQYVQKMRGNFERLQIYLVRNREKLGLIHLIINNQLYLLEMTVYQLVILLPKVNY